MGHAAGGARFRSASGQLSKISVRPHPLHPVRDSASGAGHSTSLTIVYTVGQTFPSLQL